MLESKYQKKLIDRFTKQGYYVLNLIKTNKNGVSDLLCLKSGEPPMFIEVKTLTGKMSELQKFRLREQSKLGFNTYYTKGDELIKFI